MARCKGKTGAGKRCSRKSTAGEKFCKMHLPVKEEEKKYSSRIETQVVEEVVEEVEVPEEEIIEVVKEEPKEEWTLDIPKDEFIEHMSALGIDCDDSMNQEQLEKSYEDYKKKEAGEPTEVTMEDWDKFPKVRLKKKITKDGSYFLKPSNPTTIMSEDIKDMAIREHEIVIVVKDGPKWVWEI